MTKSMALVAALCCLSGCAWDPAAELEARRTEAELQQLGQLKGLLGSGALRGDFEFFLSRGALDQALSQVGPIQVPLQGAEDAILTVSNPRIAFANGYPQVQLDATVRSDKRGISADCRTSALLFVDVTPGKLDNSTLRVVIKDIAPTITVPFYEFKIRGFWKDVAQAVAQQQIDRMPAFSLPLSGTMPASFGGAPLAMTIPTGNNSTVTGSLAIPAISSTVGLELKHVAFLEDGVHLYLNAKVN